MNLPAHETFLRLPAWALLIDSLTVEPRMLVTADRPYSLHLFVLLQGCWY
jgi:hypothetical protein